MKTVKVTVTAEDSAGIFFKETAELSREELVAPGRETPGIKTVAEALLKVASGS